MAHDRYDCMCVYIQLFFLCFIYPHQNLIKRKGFVWYINFMLQLGFI